MCYVLPSFILLITEIRKANHFFFLPHCAMEASDFAEKRATTTAKELNNRRNIFLVALVSMTERLNYLSAYV